MTGEHDSGNGDWADVFSLKICPAPEDDLGFDLVFAGQERFRFWGTDHCWSMFWDPSDIADVGQSVLDGSSATFGDIAGSGSGDQYLMFQCADKDRAMVEAWLIEKPWAPGYRPPGPRSQNSPSIGYVGRGHLLVAKARVPRERVVTEFVRCFLDYLAYAAVEAERPVHELAAADHRLLRNPRVIALCRQQGLELPGPVDAEAGLRHGLALLSERLDAVQEALLEAHNPSASAAAFRLTLRQSELRVLPWVIIAAMRLGKPYASEDEVLLALMWGELDLDDLVESILQLYRAQ